jgi:hypothetical protein
MEPSQAKPRPGTADTAFGWSLQLLARPARGWTLRQIFAQGGMCDLSYLFTKLLPEDESFAKQYARDLRPSLRTHS